jgi:hypothetical protein
MPGTTPAKREEETAQSEQGANGPARASNAVQVETSAPRDHVPASNGERGTAGSKSRRASNMAGRAASERELVHKKPKMAEYAERRADQRDALNGDISPFFRPWW